jgi:hypothetical protein
MSDLLSSSPKSMQAWLFDPGSRVQRWLHAGVGGLVLITIFKSGLKQISPSSAWTSVICLAIAFILVGPILISVKPDRSRVRWPVLLLGVAYAWMGLLYFLNVVGLAKPSVGFDAFTDVIDTLFFVAAWLLWSKEETTTDDQVTQRVCAGVLVMLLFIGGACKAAAQVGGGGTDADVQAARLVLNVSNGAILLACIT